MHDVESENIYIIKYGRTICEMSCTRKENIKVQFKAARRVHQLRNSLPQEILVGASTSTKSGEGLPTIQPSSREQLSQMEQFVSRKDQHMAEIRWALKQ